MTYGYIHAPTATPQYHSQYFKLLAFSADHNLGTIQICHEYGHTQPYGGKPVLSGMMDTMQRGDILILEDFQKLGTSTNEVLEILSSLSKRGVNVYIVNNGFRLDDNVQAQIVGMAYSLASQIERELPENTTAAPVIDERFEVEKPSKPAPRRRRSKLDGREDEIRSLMTEEVSLCEIARQLKVSRPALTDFIRSRGVVAS